MAAMGIDYGLRQLAGEKFTGRGGWDFRADEIFDAAVAGQVRNLVLEFSKGERGLIHHVQINSLVIGAGAFNKSIGPPVVTGGGAKK